MNPLELYQRLPADKQHLLDEVNYLATHLRNDLILEQFYLAFDALAQRLQQLLPETACASGCSQCCQSYALPEVLPAEWRLIEQALAELDADSRSRILASLARSAELLNQEGRLKRPRRTQTDVACPLLLDGRCAVYAFRPLDCRLTGYSFSVAAERPLPMLAQPGQALPYSCQSEQRRVLNELSQELHQLEYMFMPQREKLLATLAEIEPSGQPARLLLAALCDWAKAWA